MTNIAKQTAKLERWSDVLVGTKWPTLLVGNGASVNLWGGFAYASLREQAVLSAVAEVVFDELDVGNFEMVLEAIHHARVIVEALGGPTEAIDKEYKQVKDALFEAVHAAHIGWSQCGDERFDTIADVIQNHDAVYTTNYDLCMYWARVDAVRRSARRDVIDFFWYGKFDPNEIEIRDRIAMYYLHGAIHLWHDDRGDSGKWTNAKGGNLLSLAEKYTPETSLRPLFVSEGSSKAKLQTIRRSPYLSFCLDSLRKDRGNTVVFGQSFCDQDKHIVTALTEGRSRDIAISIYPRDDPQWIIAEKARIAILLGENKLRFFDSTTHPLGDPSLTVQMAPSSDQPRVI